MMVMIARIWHGRVKRDDADEYLAFLHERAVPDYLSIPGIREVRVLHHHDGDTTHVITMNYWDSINSIKAFAGEAYEKAKYYPEDSAFLLEFEPLVHHYSISDRFSPSE